MRKRHKMHKKHSRKLFTRTAMRTHTRNFAHSPMRGGIRF